MVYNPGLYSSAGIHQYLEYFLEISEINDNAGIECVIIGKIVNCAVIIPTALVFFLSVKTIRCKLLELYL